MFLSKPSAIFVYFRQSNWNANRPRTLVLRMFISEASGGPYALHHAGPHFLPAVGGPTHERTVLTD